MTNWHWDKDIRDGKFFLSGALFALFVATQNYWLLVGALIQNFSMSFIEGFVREYQKNKESSNSGKLTGDKPI